MKTEASSKRSTNYGFDAAFGGARRDEEKSRAKERIFSFRSKAMPGIQEISALNSGTYSTHACDRAIPFGFFPAFKLTELDVWTYIMLQDIPVGFHSISPRKRPVVERSGTWIMVDDERMPLEPWREAGDASGPLPYPRLLPLTGRDPSRTPVLCGYCS